jgi:hypothetical protein
VEKHAEKRETEYGIVHSDGQYLSANERRADARSHARRIDDLDAQNAAHAAFAGTPKVETA